MTICWGFGHCRQCFSRLFPMLPSAFRACCRISSRLQNLFCRSSEGSQCPLCSSHIFSSGHSFHALARLSGWASKWQTGLWLSTFPNTAPTANPTCAFGYPRVFPLLPQPLGPLPHLFLCGQRSSGSAGVWTHCQGPRRAPGGRLCP